MSAKDAIHEQIKQALIKEGWTITHDPYTLQFDMETQVFIDLGAERVIAAERQGEKIAVEIKTFGGYSPINNMQQAMGQYMMYVGFLKKVEADRKLYLAISDSIYKNTFKRHSFQYLVDLYDISLIVVNLSKEEIVLWKS